jgi:FkbM family methyltransferase
MNHVNYFDLGLWKKADELDYMVNNVLREFKNITYTAYGIEACPEYAKSLAQKYLNNKNVSIHNVAISNVIGKTDLFFSKSSDGLGNSIFKTKNNVDVSSKVEVQTTTFSNWLKENNIDLSNSINVLKVNIEGAELFLWEDFKKNDLRDRFQILCGHTSHDIYKVHELSDQIKYYNSLLTNLNIDLMLFCHTNKNESINNMKLALSKLLN